MSQHSTYLRAYIDTKFGNATEARMSLTPHALVATSLAVYDATCGAAPRTSAALAKSIEAMTAGAEKAKRRPAKKK